MAPGVRIAFVERRPAGLHVFVDVFGIDHVPMVTCVGEGEGSYECLLCVRECVCMIQCFHTTDRRAHTQTSSQTVTYQHIHTHNDLPSSGWGRSAPHRYVVTYFGSLIKELQKEHEYQSHYLYISRTLCMHISLCITTLIPSG